MLLARVRPTVSPRDIYPLAAAAADAPMGSLLLRDLQAAAAAAAGFTLVDVDEGQPLPPDTAAVCSPPAVFSGETLQALVAASQAGGNALVRAAIAPGTALHDAATRMAPTSDAHAFSLWAGPLAGGTASAAGPEGARVVPVCDETVHDLIRVPPYGRPPHTLRMPRVRKLGGELVHWLDVLELSLAALRTERDRRGLVAPAVERARNVIGDADIHPTAYVSGSIIEDGARVEAHAAVIDSYLGREGHVADHSVVHDCVLGAETRTLVDTSLRRVVAFGDSTLSNLAMQDALFGKGVFLTTGVSFFGPDPGQDVAVEGVDTRRAVLGGAVGARAILGARALLAAGSAIPPGALVVARPEEALAKIDDKALARASTQHGDRTRDV